MAVQFRSYFFCLVLPGSTCICSSLALEDAFSLADGRTNSQSLSRGLSYCLDVLKWGLVGRAAGEPQSGAGGAPAEPNWFDRGGCFSRSNFWDLLSLLRRFLWCAVSASHFKNTFSLNIFCSLHILHFSGGKSKRNIYIFWSEMLWVM